MPLACASAAPCRVGRLCIAHVGHCEPADSIIFCALASKVHGRWRQRRCSRSFSAAPCSCRCGKRTCRCRLDPNYLHGPYYRWTGWINGKPTTKTISEEIARECQKRRLGSQSPARLGKAVQGLRRHWPAAHRQGRAAERRDHQLGPPDGMKQESRDPTCEGIARAMSTASPATVKRAPHRDPAFGAGPRWAVLADEPEPQSIGTFFRGHHAEGGLGPSPACS
jgi:hypothetical protein